MLEGDCPQAGAGAVELANIRHSSQTVHSAGAA